jgi:hypothetical protein
MDFALVAMFKYTCGLEFYPDFGYDSVTSEGNGMGNARARFSPPSVGIQSLTHPALSGFFCGQIRTRRLEMW